MEHPTATQYSGEVGRKLIHLASALIPLLALVIPRDWMLWMLGACVLLMLVIEWVRRWHMHVRRTFERLLGFMLRRSERRGLTGATWVFTGAFFALALFRLDIAVAALLILSVSDSLAALIGRRFGREQFLGKSLAGSSAFFLSALGLGLLTLHAPPGHAFVAALVATVVEALPLRLGPLEINDNLAIPLATGAVLTLLAGAPG